VETTILYPSIDLSKFDEEFKGDEETDKIRSEIKEKYFFSLNRYERKKNINLALQAYALLLEQHPELREGKDKVELVIAGGYDLKVPENIKHREELEQLAKDLGIHANVHFYTAISNEARKYLLRNTECVLYTPEN
jgi:alpha-1,3/alpha-1,6-mannosyltransferase